MLALSGCGDDDTSAHSSAPHTAANGDVFNDADVRFASDMLQHHAQALAMVDLTVGRDLDPDLAALAEEIRSAQAPEIATFTQWLTDWGLPIPETVRDHANAHANDQTELEESQGAEFRRRWLELMIEHHKGAIEMAGDETDEGEFRPAKNLAESIEESQGAEIDRMESMLG